MRQFLLLAAALFDSTGLMALELIVLCYCSFSDPSEDIIQASSHSVDILAHCSTDINTLLLMLCPLLLMLYLRDYSESCSGLTYAAPGHTV